MHSDICRLFVRPSFTALSSLSLYRLLRFTLSDLDENAEAVTGRLPAGRPAVWLIYYGRLSKIRGWKNFRTSYITSTGFKWYSLNVAGTETPLSYPYFELGDFSFPIISPLG